MRKFLSEEVLKDFAAYFGLFAKNISICMQLCDRKGFFAQEAHLADT